MENRTIYDVISLFEFVALSGLTIFGIGNENLYALSLVGMMVAKQIPEKIIKKVVLTGNQINIRPQEAFNCNMINGGGAAFMNAGFPSGHSTVAFMLLTIFLYEYYMHRTNIKITTNNFIGSEINIPNIIFILLILAVLVPYSRYKSRCHTGYQVIGGCILGIIMGLLYTMVIDRRWLSNYPKFVEDKNRFYSLFFI